MFERFYLQFPLITPIGLIIATGKFNNGQHYHAENGETVNLSDILEAPGNGWAVPLSVTTGVVGSLAFVGAGVATGAIGASVAAGAGAATATELIAGAGIGATAGGGLAACTTGQLALKGFNGHKSMS